MASREDLSRVYEALEAADRALADALEARGRAVVTLRRMLDDEAEGFHDLPADERVIGRAKELVRSYPPSVVERFFGEVLSASAHLLKPRSIAFVGPEGELGHLAARRRFGGSASFVSFASIDDVVDEVARGNVDFGVLPFETTEEGTVTTTLRALVRGDAKVVGELAVRATYRLAAKAPTTRVERIYGTGPDFAACERFVRSRFPEATCIDVHAPSVAAERAQKDDAGAALGTELLTDLHGLEPIHTHVEDGAGAEVRYAIVGLHLPRRTGTDRTLVAMAAHDVPGALHQSLQPFADRNINLTRLETRPAQGETYRYLFFAEIDGHVTDRPLLTALEELRPAMRFLKVLGSYPRPDA